jgi:anti-anti-sigma factor
MQQAAGFRIEQHTDSSGAVKLVLVGELDLAVASALTSRLDELKAQGTTVRLDLSELTFMDSTGLGTVLSAVLDARRDDWQLEVDRTLASPVARLVEMAGVEPYLWPDQTV